MSPDDEILAILRDVPNLNVHDGSVDVDEESKVIRVDLPYVVFWGATGRDNDPRFAGVVRGRVYPFSIRGVGEDRNQAKWALKKAHSALSRKRLGISLIHHVDGDVIRRDDDLTAPGGEPIYSGLDQYEVAT